MALKSEDIHFQGEIPKISVTGITPGAKKSPGNVYIRRKHLTWVVKSMTLYCCQDVLL